MVVEGKSVLKSELRFAQNIPENERRLIDQFYLQQDQEDTKDDDDEKKASAESKNPKC